MNEIFWKVWFQNLFNVILCNGAKFHTESGSELFKNVLKVSDIAKFREAVFHLSSVPSQPIVRSPG